MNVFTNSLGKGCRHLLGASVLLATLPQLHAQEPSNPYTTEQPSILLTSSQSTGQWQLNIEVNPQGSTKPWIDLNDNGQYDKGEEKISKYGAITRAKRTQSHITIYGDVSFFMCALNNLTSLDVSKCPSLTSLFCDQNELHELDVRKNTKLKKFYCNSNQIAELHMEPCPDLVEFYCFDNNLSKIDGSLMPQLKELYCNQNELTELDLSMNNELLELSCDRNQLQALDPFCCPKLQKIFCFSNKLTSLDVSNNTQLQELYCHGNDLAELTLGNNPALTLLEAGANKLTSLNLSSCKQLRNLACDQNQLTTLDLAGNPSISNIHCHSNMINNAAVKAMLQQLPTASEENPSQITLVDTRNEKEGNICYASDIKQYLTPKHWVVFDFKGGENEGKNPYAGAEDVALSPLSSPSFSFYPNPAKEVLYITAEGRLSGSMVRLIASDGTIVRTFTLTQTLYSLELTGLSAGAYFLQIKDCSYRLIIE